MAQLPAEWRGTRAEARIKTSDKNRILRVGRLLSGTEAGDEATRFFSLIRWRSRDALIAGYELAA